MKRARQTVERVSGRWVTVCYGWCPNHTDKKGLPQRSSDFQGVDARGFLFRCRETPTHTSHLFTNEKPHNLPKTEAEAKLWLQTEIAKAVINPQKAGA